MDTKKIALSLSTLLLALPFFSSEGIAATSVNLTTQKVSSLRSLIEPSLTASKNGVSFKEVSRHVGINNTLHIRIQETFLGYRVWGGDAIIHVAHADKNLPLAGLINSANPQRSSLDGLIYKDLQQDLMNTPNYIFAKAQAEKALQAAIAKANVAKGATIKDKNIELMVYVDDANKAHWVYRVGFYVEPSKPSEMPMKPVYLLDAQTMNVYVTWNDIQTIEKEAAMGGGFGGNKKMGKVIYDGMRKNLAALKITRDDTTCMLKNDEVTVKHYRTNKIPEFKCAELNREHQVYWDDAFDTVNGGYSPDNDALFGGAIIKDMYQKWYGIPVLEENGKPMMLNMVVHMPVDNAYWDGRKMTFGDGEWMFYPLTSLGVAAHEISHGFTQQHSNLSYYGQSGGMNEAFSDMAAQAAELYAYQKK